MDQEEKKKQTQLNKIQNQMKTTKEDATKQNEKAENINREKTTINGKSQKNIKNKTIIIF